MLLSSISRQSFPPHFIGQKGKFFGGFAFTKKGQLLRSSDVTGVFIAHLSLVAVFVETWGQSWWKASDLVHLELVWVSEEIKTYAVVNLSGWRKLVHRAQSSGGASTIKKQKVKTVGTNVPYVYCDDSESQLESLSKVSDLRSHLQEWIHHYAFITTGPFVKRTRTGL